MPWSPSTSIGCRTVLPSMSGMSPPPCTRRLDAMSLASVAVRTSSRSAVQRKPPLELALSTSARWRIEDSEQMIRRKQQRCSACSWGTLALPCAQCVDTPCRTMSPHQAPMPVDADGVVVCAKPLARTIAVFEQARLQQAVRCEGCPGDTRRRRVGLRDPSDSMI